MVWNSTIKRQNSDCISEIKCLQETNISFPGREKIGKICKISGEKLVFSPTISYIILQWNAVNAVKLCKFTARVSSELTKIHHISPSTISPCTDSNLSPSCPPLILPLLHSSLNLPHSPLILHDFALNGCDTATRVVLITEFPFFDSKKNRDALITCWKYIILHSRSAIFIYAPNLQNYIVDHQLYIQTFSDIDIKHFE